MFSSTSDDPSNNKATKAAADDRKSVDSTSVPSSNRKNLLGQLWQRRSKEPLIDSISTGGGITSTLERKLDVQESADADSAIVKFIKEAGKQQRIVVTSNASNTATNDEAAAATPIKKKASGSSSRHRSSNSSDGAVGSRNGLNITRRFENASAGWIERGSYLARILITTICTFNLRSTSLHLVYYLHVVVLHQLNVFCIAVLRFPFIILSTIFLSVFFSANPFNRNWELTNGLLP